MQSARALDAFITSFERVLGKEVIFLRSGTDRVLPFDGLVLPERPNTIFLDADGHANVVALLGHEWAHTLQVTNPQLHRAMTEEMRPFVIDWLEQEGLLKEEGYGEGQVTEELVSNIVGDAFARPEFWKEFHRRNPSLFERIVRAIQEWFESIGLAARQSEWGTEGFITQLEELHGVIMSAIEQARTAGRKSPLGWKVNLPSLASERNQLILSVALKSWKSSQKSRDNRGIAPGLGDLGRLDLVGDVGVVLFLKDLQGLLSRFDNRKNYFRSCSMSTQVAFQLVST
jgi:hypothetical protein